MNPRAWLLLLVAGCGGTTASSAAATDDAASPGPDATLVDAGAPDVGPSAWGSDCGSFDFGIPATAAGSGCVFAASDVSCDVDSDCHTYPDVGHCLCVVPVWGVNASNEGGCGPPPPCLPGICGDAATGFLTEACQFVPTEADVVAVCVDHRCTTRLAVGAE